MIEKKDFEQLTESLDYVSKFLSNCQGEDTRLRNQLQSLEQELQDIEHEIEFAEMSRSERSRIAGRLKEVRVKRRYTKEMIERLDYCTHVVKDHSKIVSSLGTLSYNLKEKAKTQENRVYTPRCQKNQSTSKILGTHFDVTKEGNNYRTLKTKKK